MYVCVHVCMVVCIFIMYVLCDCYKLHELDTKNSYSIIGTFWFKVHIEDTIMNHIL